MCILPRMQRATDSLIHFLGFSITFIFYYRYTAHMYIKHLTSLQIPYLPSFLAFDQTLVSSRPDQSVPLDPDGQNNKTLNKTTRVTDLLFSRPVFVLALAPSILPRYSLHPLC